MALSSSMDTSSLCCSSVYMSALALLIKKRTTRTTDDKACGIALKITTKTNQRIPQINRREVARRWRELVIMDQLINMVRSNAMVRAMGRSSMTFALERGSEWEWELIEGEW